MINPWHKRANELIRDPSALLPLISPQPVKQFFTGATAALFDRLVVVVGSPGSGKTTLARLLEFPTLTAALDERERRELAPLLATLNAAGAISELRPSLLAVRLPANAQYRAIWELPYSESVRHKLLRSLLQARAMLGWMRQLEQEHVDLSTLRVVTATEGLGEAQRTAMQADAPLAMRQLARQTELAIFNVLSALVPPPENELDQRGASVAYDPLSSLSAFVVDRFGESQQPLELKPMLIVDDAHELHPEQFQQLDVWLRNREVRIARWVLTRVDSISPSEFRRALVAQEIERPLPGTTPDRDRLLRMLQGRDKRSSFRAIANDISKRYLARLGSFSAKNITGLNEVLSTAQPRLNATELRRLKNAVASLKKESGLSSDEDQVLQKYLPPSAPEDLRLAVARILLNRQAQRSPQRSLFGGAAKEEDEVPQQADEDDDENADEDELDEGTGSKKSVKKAVVTGAELQLLHEFDRPFFYGFERLADASNNNIEQFISLASALVDEVETSIVRGKKNVRLDAQRQHTILSQRATKIMREWDFPYAGPVRRLVDFVTQACTEITLRPSAPLGGGANAFGVPQEDLKLLDSGSDLARVIHYALAYQALVLVEEYNCKGKVWCLFELGGIPLIAGKLTLGRGGFVEGRLSQLQQVVAP